MGRASAAGGGRTGPNSAIFREMRTFFLAQRDGGQRLVPDAAVHRAFSGKLTDKERSSVLTSLAKQRVISFHHDRDELVIYEVLSDAESARAGGPMLNANHDFLLQTIHRGGSMGQTLQQLKSKSKFPHNKLQACLKLLLASKKVIEYGVRQRKRYFAAGVTPSKEVTGGLWMRNERFCHELVHTLRWEVETAVLQASRDASRSSGRKMGDGADSVEGEIAPHGGDGDHGNAAPMCHSMRGIALEDVYVRVRAGRDLASQRLHRASDAVGREHVQAVLDWLVLQGVVYSYDDNDRIMYVTRPFYQFRGQHAMAGAIKSFPCTRCNLQRVCTPDGMVSPKSCVYLNGYLRSSVLDYRKLAELPLVLETECRERRWAARDAAAEQCVANDGDHAAPSAPAESAV